MMREPTTYNAHISTRGLYEMPIVTTTLMPSPITHCWFVGWLVDEGLAHTDPRFDPHTCMFVLEKYKEKIRRQKLGKGEN